MRLEDLDDGSKLEAAWTEALSTSLAYFRALLSSAGSNAWKPVSVLPLTASSTARDTGKSTARDASLGRISASDVAVYRRSGKSGEVYRAVVEVDCGSDVSVDTFRGCLSTPETRPVWDRMVEEAATVDLLDAHTRVTKTKYRLGWPSNPRDVVTISKTMVDRHTLIDISTSLPRSRHEPTYLRPSPPYVRAHIALLGWCIQMPGGENGSTEGKARITCFWSWNPKGAWAVGGGVPQHLPSLLVGLVDYVREGSEKVPVLLGYGHDVSIGSVGYDTARVTLSVGYAILGGGSEGERRQVEFGLSSTQGWDVQINVKTQHGEESPSAVWSSFVGQAPPSTTGVPPPKRLVLRFAHPQLLPDEEMIRVSVSIERTSSSGGLRINGIPVAIEPMGTQVPVRPLLEETASAVSLRTMSESVASKDSIEVKAESGRNAMAEKNIAGLIKRNYIYFTSLLQEPEPKWRPVADSRGVAVHQLNSIDKTLVVFRAEAVFVGVGVWDLFATIANPGGRLVWDKTHDDATLLEDVNELTDLWHFKSKAAWPVAARDSVMLRTTYKSPSSIHIFGFSTDNTDLFPNIPASVDPTVIRTQIDLQGWSVEALSPNTTQVTLLEQSDPRGWSNKSSIPQVMMTTLAGIGEFAIRHGGPPICTRLGGAKALSSKYDVEKETYKLEYEVDEARRSNSSSTVTAFPLPVAVVTEENSTRPPPASNIECEIRCDVDKWSNNIVIVIDPPHTVISALKRHRLSNGGGGLWLTIEHDPIVDEKITITVRRGPSVVGAKTAVSVNGTKIKIDVEDLAESDVKLLKKQKRSRPTRAPLDQPPALGTLRKRQTNEHLSASITPQALTTFSRLGMPLARLYSVAAESTRAAIAPMATPSPTPSAGSTPVDAALRALTQLTRIHADRDGESTDPFGWQPVSERDGLKVERRVVPHVSETFPIFRSGRIIEGFTAEEVSAAVSILKKDERFEMPIRLQSHGHGIVTSFVTAHTAFPFRDRGILLSTIVARQADGPPPSPSVGPHASCSTIFHASSSSFDASTLGLDPIKYNPTTLPMGHVIIEGWILETIDPYSHDQYAIPSTRCMYVAAVDYGGSMPVSVNNILNASLPRTLLAVESILKTTGPPCRARSPAMMVAAPEPAQGPPWDLEDADEERVGVEQRNDDKAYSLTVIVQPKPTCQNNRPNQLLRPNVIDLAEDIRRGRQDLVVLEVEVGATLMKGCEVQIRGISLPASRHSDPGGSSLPLTLPPGSLDLPFKCGVITLAPSVLQSASLEPSSQTRHLLRVTLPTSGYEAPIADPLTGKTAPLPRPRWLLDLINDGVVVQLSLSSTFTGVYSHDGREIAIEDERKISRSPREPSRQSIPQLISKEGGGLRPIAVAREYMITKAPSVVETIDTEPITSSGGPETSKEEINPTVDAPHRYSFWNYSRLSRFSYTTPTSLEGSPSKPPLVPLSPESGQPSSSSDPASPLSPESLEIANLLEPVVSLPFLFFACLICLLLGSLLRSLLSDADFVLHFPVGVALPDGESWRELKRLFEFRIWSRWDLIIAVARRA